MPDMQAQARVHVHTPGPPKDLVRAAVGVHRQEAFALRCTDRESQEGPLGSSSFEDNGTHGSWLWRTLSSRGQDGDGRARPGGGRREAGGQGSELELQLSEGGSALTELQLVQLRRFSSHYFI